MDENLSKLVELARAVKMSDQDKLAQRRSFVFGNTAIENKNITRQLVDEVADMMGS